MTRQVSSVQVSLERHSTADHGTVDMFSFSIYMSTQRYLREKQAYRDSYIVHPHLSIVLTVIVELIDRPLRD